MGIKFLWEYIGYHGNKFHIKRMVFKSLIICFRQLEKKNFRYHKKYANFVSYN